ncbi:hypothetical protein FAM18132_01674 [Lacticaseibacillus paracasei]|nr:hypothetical protein FAM18101_01861 [Lacticaseibacillus paracasei]RND71343.1 hypothetical protein FAM18132_01674 [Lacticaseibacillus paracasei]
MSGKHRYIWLGVMLILCAVSIGAGTYLWQQNSRSAVNGTIPCQVDTYKNENTIFLIRPNRGNIPPRFGHFF